MYIFIDTETNGLPKNWKAPASDVDNWPRIIQFAWQVADERGNLIVEKSYLIKPDGWTIPNEKFWIDNGYTTEENQLFGFPLTVVLDEFINDYNRCTLLVAHNIKFDYPVVAAEMIRYNKRASVRLEHFCTMLQSVGINGSTKWPKLIELYTFLFNKEFENAHDAGADVTACRECFFELKNR